MGMGERNKTAYTKKRNRNRKQEVYSRNKSGKSEWTKNNKRTPRPRMTRTAGTEERAKKIAGIQTRADVNGVTTGIIKNNKQNKEQKMKQIEI